jgi:hypothetical protein
MRSMQNSENERVVSKTSVYLSMCFNIKPTEQNYIH